jgi:hypothetical protein
MMTQVMLLPDQSSLGTQCYIRLHASCTRWPCVCSCDQLCLHSLSLGVECSRQKVLFQR